jgi:hypothetical protein
MQCKVPIVSSCTLGHKMTRRCHENPGKSCKSCDEEARRVLKRREREHKLEQERQIKQQAYAHELAKTQDEIDYVKRCLKDKTEEVDRKNALEQRRQDLENLKARATELSKKQTTSKTSAHRDPTMPVSPNGQSSNAAGKASKSSPAGSNSLLPSKHKEKESTTEGGEATKNGAESEAKDDWEYQKDVEGAKNQPLDYLMKMIGLESVKRQFLDIKDKVDTIVRQQISLADERFGAVLLGNPGTGKTTVARIYAQFLVEVGALPGGYFLETSGSALANDGINACKAHIDKILEEGGGVFFIDEAYQLVSGNSYGGKAVLDYLLAEIENLTGKIVFVLAGYRKQMEAFFQHNPGIPSRIPKCFDFDDYRDEELHQILCSCISKKYSDRMKVHDGLSGLYMRIACCRIGRGRGREGFANARDVQNRLSQITERQAKRLRKERRVGLKPDDNFLTKEDLIGPDPSAVLSNNAAWMRLQKMIGLQSVKSSVQILLDTLQSNYRRELQEMPLIHYSLNKCFIGSPGTGKTSVAKLYGRILADIGLLSNGEGIGIMSPEIRLLISLQLW